MSATAFFRRVFVKGHQAGLKQDDKVSFPTAGDALNWVRNVNKRNAEGELDYKITEFQVMFPYQGVQGTAAAF